MDIILNKGKESLTNKEILESLEKSIKDLKLSKVLLIPPDFTRFHSNAGMITNFYYHYLVNKGVKVDILPALGTHIRMSKEECEKMYGDIPYDKFIYHNWREDVVKIGEVPSSYLKEISEGLWEEPVDVEVNKIVIDKSYDLVISIGQVVPHEVVGMANHAKNIFVGCGGKSMINSSHMLGAVYGIERIMGKDFTPVRKLFDYALTNCLKGYPILFVLTVTSNDENGIKTHGLFIGEKRNVLEEAIKLSLKINFTALDKPIKKCIVYLDENEFKTTWLGNKAVYRTRMAIADEGELIILAPGVTRFGEDEGVDKLIRKYGYVGRIKVLELFKKNKDLQENMSAAAHLIHGSNEDRFKTIYAVKKISKEEIKGVNFIPDDFDTLYQRYNVKNLKPGFNMVNGEEIYFIPNPALGLWIYKGRM